MTKARAAEVARQYEQGKSIDTLIAEFKSSYYSVRKAVMDNGVKLRPANVSMKAAKTRQSRGKPSEWTDEIMQLAIKTYEKGSLADVSDVTGFSKTYCNMKLKEEGVPLRKAHKTLGKRARPGNTKDITMEKKYDFGKFQSFSIRASV